MSKRTTDVSPIRRLLALCMKDAAGLERVIARLFATPVTSERLAALDTDEDLAERVDAFAARFGRLQDALSDKLLPAYFDLVEESPRPLVEMLDCAERLGLVSSADLFIAAGKLRNRLVHEYVEDRAELADNLNAARLATALLTATLAQVTQALTRLQDSPLMSPLEPKQPGTGLPVE